MVKSVVLIIASRGYQPVEYENTRTALEEAGINVVVASDAKGTARSKPVPGFPDSSPVDIIIPEIDPAQYGGIFLIGGPGALEHLDNETTRKFMQKVAKEGKPFGAICISPRILAFAGLLGGKKATGWDDDGELAALFKKHGVDYVKEPVVIDGKIITAEGPTAATAFGQAIASVLQKSN